MGMALAGNKGAHLQPLMPIIGHDGKPATEFASVTSLILNCYRAIEAVML